MVLTKVIVIWMCRGLGDARQSLLFPGACSLFFGSRRCSVILAFACDLPSRGGWDPLCCLASPLDWTIKTHFSVREPAVNLASFGSGYSVDLKRVQCVRVAVQIEWNYKREELEERRLTSD